MIIYQPSRDYFIRPPHVTLPDYIYLPDQGFNTYSEYNYLQPGLISFLQTRHFEHALRLSKEHFHKCNVIDFGCGDGPLLPSLSKYFEHVVGIDNKPEQVKLAAKVVAHAKLNNIELICNRNVTMDDLHSRITSKKYHVLYLLETLEHVGDKADFWGSKIRFIRDLFNLLDKDGYIIMSVPVMIGIPFLIQRLGLFLRDANREPLSTANLIKATLFQNTDDLEKQWDGYHLGFNHKKLKGCLEKDFHIVRTKNLFFQVIYVCQRRTTNA